MPGSDKGPTSTRPPLTLKGHAGRVFAVAFTPGGERLFSGGEDGKVLVWDVADGTDRGRLNNPGHWWSPIAFTPDGSTMLAGDQQGTVVLWDMANGRSKGYLRSQDAIIQLITVLADGKTLVTGDDKGGVRFWDLTTGKEEKERRLEVEDTLALAITPDGKTLASTGAFKQATTVKVWDVATGGELLTLQGEQSVTSSAVGTGKGDIRQWQQASPVQCVAISSAGTMVAAGRADGTVSLWEVPAGK
jgi:WD40 repeat protein